VGEVSPVAAEQTGLPIGLPVMAGGQDHVCAALALGVTEPGTLLDSIGTAEAFFLPTREPTYEGPVVDAGIPQGAHVVAGRSYAMWGLNPGGGRIDGVRGTSGLEWGEFLLTDQARSESESLAEDAHDAIEWIVAAVGVPITRHIVTGGGARNPLLITAKQARSALPIEVSDVPQAACLGAAMLAGCPGVGVRTVEGS
jgi:xylulokinase